MKILYLKVVYGLKISIYNWFKEMFYSDLSYRVKWVSKHTGTTSWGKLMSKKGAKGWVDTINKKWNDKGIYHYVEAVRNK